MILIDTREKKNSHLLDYFNKHKIEYRYKGLKFGDYSFEVDGISYESKIVVERKNSLSEIAVNLTKYKTRFENELLRARGCKVHVMIENGSWDGIRLHQYRSRLSPKDFESRLKTWQYRFMFQLDFITKQDAAKHIIKTFQDYLKG